MSFSSLKSPTPPRFTSLMATIEVPMGPGTFDDWSESDWCKINRFGQI